MNKKQIEQEELLLKRLPEYTAVEYLADSFASAICFALRDKRKEIGMSQKEVEKITGIRQPKICRLEGFFHVPTLTTVGKYLYALGYTIEDVYKIALFIKYLKRERTNQDKETLFLNPITEEMKAFDSIIFQKRDENYISDAYRGDIGVVADSLEVLANFREMLNPNTLCRICGAKGYEIIEIMKTNTAIKRWLEDE